MRPTVRLHWRLGAILGALLVGALAVTAALSVEDPQRTDVAGPPRVSTPLQSTAEFVPLPQAPQLDPLAPSSPVVDLKTYNGRTFKYVKTLRLRVTAYAPDPRCCWPYPGTTTASGLPVTTNRGRLVAADTRLIPLHALVSVPGYAEGKTVPVLDRGGAITGYRLDVLMPTYEQAKAWGSRILDVPVYLPAR